MPPAAKSFIALIGAVGLVVGAVAVRRTLDDKQVNDAISVRLTCDPVVLEACQKAAAADARITVTAEALATTQKRLRNLETGRDPGLDAWVTVGPWMAMVDGARPGQAPLGRRSTPVVSSPVTLVGRAEATACAPTPIGCATVRSIGLRPPPQDGIALAGAIALVARAGGVPITDLDRAALVSGTAATPLNALKAAARPIGLEAVNTSFSTAQVVVTTAAAARSVAAGRASVAPLPVRAVVETALLRDDAAVPLAADAPGGRALHDALVTAGWEAAPQPSGLPDPGVLVALQEVWGS